MTAGTRLQARVAAIAATIGTPVTFTREVEAYDPLTDSGDADEPTTATANAVTAKGDPDRFAALGTVLTNPVTILVPAEPLAFAPEPGQTFTLLGDAYTVRDVEPMVLNGLAVYYRVTGGV